MLARVHSAAAFGIDARVLDVEIDVSDGLPCFTIVGLPDTTVKEARERVRSALRNSGFPFASRAITVNLAPADFRKVGALLDLPVAIGLLLIDGLPVATARRRLFVGELGLTGEIRPVRGVLCLASAAADAGFEEMVVPADNAAEASAVERLAVIPVGSLTAAVAHLSGRRSIEPFPCAPTSSRGPSALDFADVVGQAVARRALEICAAGGHHAILVGPPGAGKTMLARRLATILPPLTRGEAIEATKIHSVAGALAAGSGLVEVPPFRSPHHGISAPGLVGGGTRPTPGEISLAHKGVLFLDELPEFRRDVLEAIRQPLEEKRISIVRVGGAYDFPADFLLVAAMNPCPCGFAGDPKHPCSCDWGQRQRYARKISGPLLDRIDLHVSVPAVPWSEIARTDSPEPSAPIRERVAAARRLAASRFPGSAAFRNAELPVSELDRILSLDGSGRRLVATVVERLRLSLRALHRALRVARTIADLEGASRVTAAHLAEAVGYRLRNAIPEPRRLDRGSPATIRCASSSGRGSTV